MERFTDHIEDWFKAFPNLDSIDTSTNFTVPKEPEIIEELLHGIEKNYKKYKDKPFDFCLQLSIDGDEELNDAGRGKGTTQKFLNNFKDLCKIQYNPEIVHLRVHTKPTWSRNLFHYLDTEEKCFNWYKFFSEKMYDVSKSANSLWPFMPGLANIAGPTEHNKEDGIAYANIIQNIFNIEDEVQKQFPVWSEEPTIVQPASFMLRELQECPCGSVQEQGERFAAPRCGGHCGVFTNCIVPIPHGKYTMCHRGLFDSYLEYCNNVSARNEMHDLSEKYFKSSDNAKFWIYDKQDFKTLHDTMSQFYLANQIQYTDLITFIREYAIAGLIDEKYKDIRNIEPTLSMQMGNSYCVQDAFIFSGSWVTMSGLDIPLLYNGVADIVLKEIEKVMRKEGMLL